MLNKRTEIISKSDIGTNTPWQVTIAWTETSDVKLKFLEIFEIFGACSNLILLL